MFVVIEGIDGAGKTTVVNMLKKSFPKATFIRTPGGRIPEIRDIVMNPKYDTDPLAKMFFFLGEMVDIQNKFGEDELVICDRLFLSTYIYQVLGNAHLMSKAQHDCAVYMFTNFLKSVDMTFILIVGVQEAMKRSENFMEFGTKDPFESAKRVDWVRRKYFYDHPEELPIRYKLGQIEIIGTSDLPAHEVSLKITNSIIAGVEKA